MRLSVTLGLATKYTTVERPFQGFSAVQRRVERELKTIQVSGEKKIVFINFQTKSGKVLERKILLG